MKRTLLIITSLLFVLPWLHAVQYQTYMPQYQPKSYGALWTQSSSHSSYAANPYLRGSQTSAALQHQWGNISSTRNLSAVGSATPQRVEALSGDMHPFAVSGGPKFAPPGGEGGGTGNEDEPEPTKIIDQPIGDGIIFVLFLSIIMLIIKYLKDEKKLLFSFNGNVN